MANIEYAHKFTYGIETSQTQPGLTVTKGSWTRETTDRVLPPPSEQSGRDIWHNRFYKQLPEGIKATRILQLEPGGFLDVLRGSLQECIISHTGPSVGYTALSYVWGDPSDRSDILIDGQTIQITANLGRALRQVRHEELPMSLWADAICINQSNLLERNEQVGIMVDIFTAASRAFAWLGPETENTAVGMAVLRHMLMERPGEKEAPWAVLPADIILPGITDIALRPYFKRMWVVQEASLAAEVELACGSHSIVWKNTIDVVRRFERSIKLAGISPQRQSMGLPNLSSFLQLLTMQLDLSKGEKPFGLFRRHPPTMLDAIYELRHRQVTDPRDRYYALLAVISLGRTARLEPDYSLPVEEVYARVIELVMEEELMDSPESVARSGFSYPEHADLLPALGSAGRSPGDHGADFMAVTARRLDDDMASEATTKSESEEALQQRDRLIAHVEATCSRAAALIAEDKPRKAAALLSVLASGVENSGDGDVARGIARTT
ncbi:hypothetical protein LTR97_007496 [Elasticomyces elasticus]|uniref:Heterokaryon incompatibility domain-containing protein n=1 Tax=Elasticomyces elasticus TaxID=574655 RepID=A0AAN7ZTD5_9PEZI|nr:hypothetical protein LTR97_007496 [Elasticomyces elasticus]